MIIVNAECDFYLDAIRRDGAVKDAAVYEADDFVLIALLSDGVFTRSGGIALENRAQMLAELCFDGKEITVSRDADIFYKLKRADTDAAAKILFDTVKSRKAVKST